MTPFSLLVLPFLCLLDLVSGNKCTNVLSRERVQEVVVKDPCIQSYTARCGWLSLNYCTFYTQALCDKKVNETIKTYYIVTDCCAGYMLAADGTCIKKKPGMIYPSTPRTRNTSVNPDYKPENKVPPGKKPARKTEMTGGVYAGIGCGLVLIASITIFIVIAIRKKKKKKSLEDESGQHRLFVPTSSDHPSIIRTSYNTGNNSVQISREVTAPSSRMATPPTSPAETKPVQQPLLNTHVDMNEIPESDI